MLGFIVLFFLLFFTAILSCSETAFFSLPQFTLSSYRASKDKREKKIARLLSSPRDLLVTILILNIFANVLVQNTFSNILGDKSWVLKVGIPLVFVLIFGEIIPKSLAIVNNKKVSKKVVSFISCIFYLLSPVRFVLGYITNFASRFLFFFLKKPKPISKEELQHMVEESTDVLSKDEKDFVEGYLELHRSTIKDKMKPKDDILFYNISDPISSLIKLFVDKKYAKVPVCDGSVDKIVGIVSVNDFFLKKKTIKNKEDLKRILKAPFFVPDSTNSWDLLLEMRSRDKKIAIVVDEYGVVKGLISQSNLVERVVGDIEDSREELGLYRASDDVIIAKGNLELSEFEDIFGYELKSSSGQTTVGGWLLEQFEKIPKTGEKLLTKDFLFYVLEAAPNLVKSIYIRKLGGK